MKLSNIELDNALHLLEGLRETGKLGYAIARNIRILSTELTEYHKAIQNWARSKGKKDGESFTISEMYADLHEICDTELEVNLFQVEEDTFTGGTLTSDQMARMLWMVAQ